MQKIFVDLESKKYDILIDSDLLKKIPAIIKEKYDHKKYLIVTDENVSKLYLSELVSFFETLHIEVVTHIIPVGETSKSLKELDLIYDNLVTNNFTRKDAIISFGGGVTGDLSGFAASTYLRGIDFIQIPTTLLSQVDSSVGGKVGINLKHGKNLVGSFYQPIAVYIDIDVLKSLNDREYNSGLAEIIKYACIYDENLFDKLNSYKNLDNFKENIIDIIKICLDIKVKFVEKDEKENDLRKHLNFGHTIGHGIEKYFEYDKYNHGEGVSIGMYYILRGSYKLGLVDKKIFIRLKNILKKYNLIYECEISDTKKLMSYIKNDKKSLGDNIDVILLKKIGESKIERITMNKLYEILKMGIYKEE